mgnify:FL=1|tara:strand:+ start:481 stop:669 length:189 start_codon:yes stop_codon:yes gene_type:complete
MKLTKKEIEDFEGMNEANIEMQDKIDAMTPMCHMTPMRLDGAEDPWQEGFWECDHCGHTKAI